MIFLGKCNLCNWPIIKINSGYFGHRCIKCRSTQIHRALGLVFSEFIKKPDAAIYEMSSRGAFFDFLKQHYSNITISEYYDDVPGGEIKNGIRCEDVQKLTFADSTFDVVSSTEVFEHVPDDALGFKEVFRVLKPGGYHIFTVPLLLTQEKTIERAKLENGNIIHMLPPEYHGDRIRGSNHVLAFRNYGADIKDRLLSAGFKHVELRDVKSDKHRIFDKAVVVAQK